MRVAALERDEKIRAARRAEGALQGRPKRLEEELMKSTSQPHPEHDVSMIVDHIDHVAKVAASITSHRVGLRRRVVPARGHQGRGRPAEHHLRAAAARLLGTATCSRYRRQPPARLRRGRARGRPPQVSGEGACAVSARRPRSRVVEFEAGLENLRRTAKVRAPHPLPLLDTRTGSALSGPSAAQRARSATGRRRRRAPPPPELRPSRCRPTTRAAA